MKESLHDQIYCHMIQYHTSKLIRKNKDATFHLPISEFKKLYFHDCSIYLDYKQSLANVGIQLHVFLKGHEEQDKVEFDSQKQIVSIIHPNYHMASFKQFSSIFL